MKVSVLGCGTVGGGVIQDLAAAGFELGPALVRTGKAREAYQTEDFLDILRDPTVDAVVETLGGLEPARGYCAAALRAGKSVVTANKALVGNSGPELAALARENGVGFLFSSACGGGVPFLPNLSAAAESGVTAVGGVLNGTTNYLLDAMQRYGLSFSDALLEAQKLGYAEADPSDDLNGLDTARKLALACAVGFSLLPPEGTVSCEGVREFTAEDAAYLDAHDLVCRLYARAEHKENSYTACVQPTLFPRSAPESTLRGCENMARYGTDVQTVALTGSGAGRRPTAGAVIRDLLTLRRGQPVMLPEDCRREEPDNSLLSCRYLFRVPAALAGEVPGQPKTFGNNIWIETPAMPVVSAHGLAAGLRERGPVFFAALADKEEERICAD